MAYGSHGGWVQCTVGRRHVAVMVSETERQTPDSLPGRRIEPGGPALWDGADAAATSGDPPSCIVSSSACAGVCSVGATAHPGLRGNWQAVALLVLQCMEGAALINLLQTSLRPYEPLPQPWFKYDWGARDAVAAGLGGGAVALLAAGAAVGANQLLGNTGDATAAAPVQGLLQDGCVPLAPFWEKNGERRRLISHCKWESNRRVSIKRAHHLSRRVYTQRSLHCCGARHRLVCGGPTARGEGRDVSVCRARCYCYPPGTLARMID